jgi:hypothetical protein
MALDVISQHQREADESSFVVGIVLDALARDLGADGGAGGNDRIDFVIWRRRVDGRVDVVPADGDPLLNRLSSDEKPSRL